MLKVMIVVIIILLFLLYLITRYLIKIDKESSVKTVTTNFSKCYLRNSKLIPEKIIIENDLSVYQKILKLSDEEAPFEMKEVIRVLLIPYKISFLKFKLNSDFFEGLFPLNNHDDFKQIAPSLIKIKEKKLDQKLSYPSWFFVAFPDVVIWENENKPPDIYKFLNKNTEEDIKLIVEMLYFEVDLYVEETKKELECKYY